jgi:hypothetical protein
MRIAVEAKAVGGRTAPVRASRRCGGSLRRHPLRLDPSISGERRRDLNLHA